MQNLIFRNLYVKRVVILWVAGMSYFHNFLYRLKLLPWTFVLKYLKFFQLSVIIHFHCKSFCSIHEVNALNIWGVSFLSIAYMFTCALGMLMYVFFNHKWIILHMILFIHLRILQNFFILVHLDPSQ